MEVGDRVRLKNTVKHHTCPRGRQNNRTARIAALLELGGVHTDRDLRGCRWWHVDDLEVTDEGEV